MGLTVEQIKKKKVTLETDILNLVQGFEKETNTYISWINTQRKVSKSKKDDPEHTCCVPEPERQGPLVNVNIDLRFDL